MKVTNANDVPIYDLTTGKSLPDWLDERKRRTLLKKDDELRRRIELIQEFDMPGVSDSVTISKDENYIIATGTYKPRVKCYDVNQLGLKFERCFDSEVIKCELIADDYSKIVFLQCDRYVEIHSQGGRYYRLRIPKFGRDLKYHPGNCDMYFVGDGSDIIRLNLEQGRFLNPITSDSIGINVVELNLVHQLLVTGTVDGKVEGWDPRSRSKAGALDVAMSLDLDDLSIPSITSLAFRDGINLGVGTSTGHILLYDIRSSKPLLMKDHMYGHSIKKILFHSTLDTVVSLDERILKIWNRSDGKSYTSIESPGPKYNDISIYPNSGLLLLANEQPKMQVHYIPTLGPAPKWCAFLDNITEDLEESNESSAAAIYDDYKFVTKEEIEDLGLEHLIGSSLLRAHMHGFFMDVRLYSKAQSLAKPYALSKLLSEKVKSKLDEKREKRVQLKSKIPSVNKDLFLKLKEQKNSKKKGGQLLEDDRFQDIFTDPQFEVDTNEEVYRLLNPVVSKLDKSKQKKMMEQFEEVESDREESSESSDDDAQDWTTQVREEHKQLRIEKAISKREDKEAKVLSKISHVQKRQQPKIFELKEGETLGVLTNQRKNKNCSLEERIKRCSETKRHNDGHVMTFRTKKSFSQMKKEREEKQHREERQKLRRSASGLKKKRIAPKFFMGKRVI